VKRLWDIPATSIVLVLCGEVTIFSKVYGPGECYFPKVFDGAMKRMLKVIPNKGAMILDMPFTKYALINKKYLKSPGANGELL
jgi:hypothetical protein